MRLFSREVEKSTSESFFPSAEPGVFPIWPLYFTFSVIPKLSPCKSKPMLIFMAGSISQSIINYSLNPRVKNF